ncbi:MAG: biopolymer transporter ExbD [Phycisphaerales bacterium]
MNEPTADLAGLGAEGVDHETVGAAHPYRRRGALNQWELHFGPNMTPMVDVVMVILIFFMASTAFLGPEWFLKANMTPEEVASGGRTPDRRFELPEVRLNVHLRVVDGVTLANAFGREGLTMDDLDALAAEVAKDIVQPEQAGRDPEDTSGEPLVIIAPESDVPYNDVVRAHDACTRAGFRRVALR